MILRWRTGFCLVACLAAGPQVHALFNLNQGKDMIFVSTTYTVGFDSNVFTRSTARDSVTQNFTFSADYSRNAGLIGVTANIGTSTGRFESVRSQDFADPTLTVSFRKRYGRTTGALRLQTRRESQPDPDAGARTRAWNHNLGLDVRYPVNDRYFFTNGFNVASRLYSNSATFSDLTTITDSVALNYAFTSKLDLNAAYTFGYSQTSKNTNAFDHRLTLGASGGILPKLSGTVNLGLVRRANETSTGLDETFHGFSSGTSLKWLFSRRLSFNADLNSDISTTSTDISVLRTSGGFHATASVTSKYILNTGVIYTVSRFLGSSGGGRADEMLQFNASLGRALTTNINTSVSYVYMLNLSNTQNADFERHTVSFMISATY